MPKFIFFLDCFAPSGPTTRDLTWTLQEAEVAPWPTAKSAVSIGQSVVGINNEALSLYTNNLQNHFHLQNIDSNSNFEQGMVKYFLSHKVESLPKKWREREET